MNLPAKHRRAVAALLVAAVAGCGRPSTQATPAPRPEAVVGQAASPSPDATRAPVAPVAAPPPVPIEAPGTTIALDVAPFADAAVAVPSTGASPHGVVVAAHGNFDRPEWECDFWKRLFPSAFVLCPRGVERPDTTADDPRFTYENATELAAELDAGARALEARFGAAVDARRMTWVGLSRGAFLGAEVAARRPALFPRLLLVEGGHDPWTLAHAVAFAKGGGERVQFVCGQRSCTLAARNAAARLERAGVATRVDEVAGMGHGLSLGVDPIVRASAELLAPGPPEPPGSGDAARDRKGCDDPFLAPDGADLALQSRARLTGAGRVVRSRPCGR